MTTPDWKSVRLPLGDQSPEARLLYGVDVRSGLRAMASNSVHVACTSPPYWGLRDYGAEGQIGLEESPEEYVQNLVDVFREVKRVLRSDGTLWLNLGDSYAKDGVSGLGLHTETSTSGAPNPYAQLRNKIPDGLKPKDLVGIPWRVAFALQADGWYLRAACPWVKRNVMPTSVQDRPTTAVEMVFLLAHPDGDGRYYYDIDAIRVGHAAKSLKRYESGLHMRTDGHAGESSLRARASAGLGQSDRMGDFINMAGRNRRDSDWFFESIQAVLSSKERLIADEGGDPLAFVVNPKSYPGAHFACWPPELVEPMIKAGSSARGCCPSCGAPWKRDVEQDEKQAGWKPGCSCESNDGSARPVVLDPFSGSATTGQVALHLNRDYRGLDINAEYLPLAEARLVSNAAPAKPISTQGTLMDLFGE